MTKQYRTKPRRAELQTAAAAGYGGWFASASRDRSLRALLGWTTRNKEETGACNESERFGANTWNPIFDHAVRPSPQHHYIRPAGLSILSPGSSYSGSRAGIGEVTRDTRTHRSLSRIQRQSSVFFGYGQVHLASPPPGGVLGWRRVRPTACFLAGRVLLVVRIRPAGVLPVAVPIGNCRKVRSLRVWSLLPPDRSDSLSML